MNCENCKHWIYGYCRLLDCRREKDFLCNAWELSASYERTAKMTAELEMSLTDKLLESRQSPETLLARIAELEAEVEELKPYRDGYDASKDFPDEGENVIAYLGNWRFVANYRNGKWYDSLGAQAEIRGGVDRWWRLPEVEE